MRLFGWNRVSQIKNKSVCFFQYFWGSSILEKICFQHLQKVELSSFLCSDWEFGRHHKTDFDVCLWFCDLVHSQWPVSVKYHSQKYDYSFHFRFVLDDSPQINEKTTQVFEENVNEKRKHFEMSLAAK